MKLILLTKSTTKLMRNITVAVMLLIILTALAVTPAAALTPLPWVGLTQRASSNKSGRTSNAA